METDLPPVWKPLWGRPQPGYMLAGIRHPTIAERGGVATLVRRPSSAFHDNTLTDINLFHDRIQLTRLALGAGGVFLYIFNVYAHSGSKGGRKKDREKLLHCVLNTMPNALGKDVPVVVCGDLNTSVSASYILREAVKSGWTDAAVVQAQRLGCVPPPTFMRRDSEGTRIDHVLLNEVAAAALSRCTTHHVGVPQHSAVTVELSLAAFTQLVYRFVVPKDLSMVKPDLSVQRSAQCAALLAAKGFHEAEARLDVHDMWNAVSQASEEYLLLCARDDGIPTNRGHRGRGEVRQPVQKTIAAPTTKYSTGAAPPRQVELARLANMSLELQIQLKRLANGGFTVMEHKTYCLWASTLRKCKELRVRDLSVDELPLGIAEQLTLAADLHTSSATLASDLGRDNRVYREKQLKLKAVHNFDVDRKKLTAFCRGTLPDDLLAVARRDGTLTANAQEMDAILQEEWKSVFQLYRECPEPEYDDFDAVFGKHVAKHNMDLLPLTGEDLDRVLQSKKKSGACGVDGWRMGELKRLPVVLLNAFATTFNEIEESGTWPEALLTALVTLTPKGEGKGPLDHRPITVTSSVYRLWASARVRSIQKWQETWVHKDQHGFRPRHGAHNVLFDICTQLEDALSGGEPLYGLALDFAKCFDRVPQKLTLELAARLGLHPRILQPLRTMYEQLQRRFQLPLGVGTPFRVTNGILQGCPISVVLINALVAVLLKDLDSCKNTCSRAYADDITLLSRKSMNSLEPCLRIVERFCAITGMKLNDTKTVAFGSRESFTSTLVSNTGHRYKTLVKVKILGVYLYCSKHSRRSSPERVRKAIAALQRLRCMPLAFYHKYRIVSECILPGALYEVPYALPSQSSLKELSTAVNTCLWGSDYGTRAGLAIRTVLLKSHRTDPAAIICNRSMNVVLDHIAFDATLRERCLSIHKRYNAGGGWDFRPHGPVGNMTSTSILTGVRWCDDLTTVTELSSAPVEEEKTHALGLLAPGERHHAIREIVRRQKFTDLALDRPTYDGAQYGVNLADTTYLHDQLQWSHPLLAYRLRRIICDGILYAHPTVLCLYESTKRGGIHLEVNQCPLCLTPTSGLAKHLLWTCPHTVSANVKEAHRPLLDRIGPNTPSCLAMHGIAPTNTPKHVVTDMQRYLLDVTTAVDDHLSSRTTTAPARHPWRMDFEVFDAPPYQEAIYRQLAPFFGKDDDPRCKQKRRELKQMLLWASSLKWSTANLPVTCVELAIDLEIFHRIYVLRPTSNIRERAAALRTLLNKLHRLCKALGIQNPFPASAISSSRGLRSIGAPGLIGYDRRPVFTYPRYTMHMPEHVIVRAKITNSGWGNDIIPDNKLVEASAAEAVR